MPCSGNLFEQLVSSCRMGRLRMLPTRGDGVLLSHVEGIHMKKEESSTGRANPPPIVRDEQPLLKALVAEATRRGETLASLAKALGVTYERLAQWRRNDALINNAHRSVHERAAKYLGLPTVLVLMFAGSIGLEEFVWPGRGSLKDRICL